MILTINSCLQLFQFETIRYFANLKRSRFWQVTFISSNKMDFWFLIWTSCSLIIANSFESSPLHWILKLFPHTSLVLCFSLGTVSTMGFISKCWSVTTHLVSQFECLGASDFSTIYVSLYLDPWSRSKPLLSFYLANELLP